MKYFSLVTIGLLVVFISFAQNSFKTEYKMFGEQVQGISPLELENLYQRSEKYYLKNFSDAYMVNEIYYLDSTIQKFGLTSGELDLLKQNRFFVSERLSYQNFGQAFHDIYNFDLPVFISTDAVLHALHMSYNQILKNLEREIMATNLEQFLYTLYQNFPQQVEKYGNSPEMINALKDADLYITVAYSLICDEFKNAQFEDSEKVKEVWDKIFEEKMVEMPLFTFPERKRRIDYSQFTVRGHYVFTEQDKWMGLKSLEPYFRTMMWLGRIDFLLTPPPPNPWELEWTSEEIIRMQQAAFIINNLVELSSAKHLFEFNENIINYLVGESDNILQKEFSKILTDLSVYSAVQLTDTLVSQALISAFNANPELAQKILSDFFLMDPNGSEPGVLPISYRLSGQRFILDSYILGNVVFDRLVQNGQKIMRMMPNPLDAIFVLGNNDALPLLEPDFEKFAYSEQLAKLRFLVDYKTDQFWNSSLYNVWLNAIRELNPPENENNLPLFMRTAAWHHEKINTQLASWAQLRHDNLLYAKQSYTGGTGCSFPYSFVEPYPEFYSRLEEFAHNAGEFFSSIPAASYEIQKIVQFFPNFETIMKKLKILAEKELNKTPFSDDEVEWLKSMLFQESGSGIPPYSGWYTQLFYDAWDAAEGDFTVVDIHTQPTDEFGNVVGKVLHAGVGEINLGVFITTSPNSNSLPTSYVGPVMSYYEKITDSFKRLTDQEWELMVSESNLPERPNWTNIYLAGEKGEKKETSIEIPSKLYTQISENANVSTAYYVYPNPAFNKIFIRQTNPAQVTNVEIYNIQGVLVKKDLFSTSTMFEYQVDIAGLNAGIYFLHISNNEGVQSVSKFIKK